MWSTFMQLSKYYNTRIDVTFDPYHDKSIKGTESSRGEKSPDILIKVIRTDKLLPIEIEKFWPVSENKVSFQQFFIEWVQTNCCDHKSLYLGGSHQEDGNKCLLVSNVEKKIAKRTLTQMHPWKGLCFIWVMRINLASSKVLSLPLQIQMFLFLYTQL